jgi:uncharacterized repeat protein (TIGR03803 family)
LGTTEGGGAYGYGTVYQASPSAFSSLYNFCSAAGCADGAEPVGSLLFGAGRLMYGTTISGGAHGLGVVFKFSDPLGGSASYTVLHSFAGGSDGAIPYSGLAANSAGTFFYGTTYEGGTSDSGTVFQLDVSSGVVTVLYSFNSSGPSGAFPVGGVVMNAAGDLYGTTGGYGANGYGTIWEITAGGAFEVLHSFTGGADGGTPQGTLALDTSGNLYGTAFHGGFGYGTLFEVTSGGTFGVLHTFCPVAGCSDGASPTGPLYCECAAGNNTLTGTMYSGGTYGKGVVFELTP